MPITWRGMTARPYTAVGKSRAAPVRVPGDGSPVVANVFGRGLGANGVPSLQEGTLRTLGTQLDEMKRNLDRREKAMDEREARLIGVEAIEAGGLLRTSTRPTLNLLLLLLAAV